MNFSRSSFLKFVFAQALLGLGIVAGFAREITLASFFGLGETLDLFRNASLLPVVCSETLNAAFVFSLIPHLVAAEKMEESEARVHVSAAIYVALGLVLVMFILGFAASPILGQLLFPGNRSELLTASMRWSWVMFLMTGVTFGLRGMFFQEGKTWPGASAPLVRSLGFLIFLGALKVTSGSNPLPLSFAVAALIGSGGAVLLMHLLAMDRRTASVLWNTLFHPAFDKKVYRSVLAALAMSLAYYALNAFPRILDQGFTSKLASGSVSAVELSYSVTMAFGILFATAFNMTQAVKISRGVRDKTDQARNAAYVGVAMGGLAAIFGIIFAILANPLMNVILHHGKMSSSGVSLVADLFQVQCLGIGFLVLGLISAQFLIAFGRFDILIYGSLTKFSLKFALLNLILPSHDIFSTVKSFVLVEAVGATIFTVIVYRELRHLLPKAVQSTSQSSG